MVINDDTQPKRPPALVPSPVPSYEKTPQWTSTEAEGPGCWLWGIVGLFSLLLALAVVLLAGFAGWSEGQKVGQANATATRSQDIQTQCGLIQQELAAKTLAFLNVRIANLQAVTPMPDCLANAIPSATALYLTSLPTSTPTATITPTITATLDVTAVATTSGAPLAVTATTGGTQFDPAPLLAEARTQIASAQWADAVDTLDAVMAISATYEAVTVKQLMFQSLTEQARAIYASTEGNLAQAILLTNRAEQYGDVSNNPLNFERAVAQSYLNAQAAKGMNYPLAIQLFNDVVNLSPNYKDARAQLIGQYKAYGDFLVQTGKPCDAVPQYDAAVTQNAGDDVRVKRDNAALACSTGATATPDPSQLGAPTTDPNQPPAPTQPSVAPIGQP